MSTSRAKASQQRTGPSSCSSLAQAGPSWRNHRPWQASALGLLRADVRYGWRVVGEGRALYGVIATFIKLEGFSVSTSPTRAVSSLLGPSVPSCNAQSNIAQTQHTFEKARRILGQSYTSINQPSGLLSWQGGLRSSSFRVLQKFSCSDDPELIQRCEVLGVCSKVTVETDLGRC